MLKTLALLSVLGVGLAACADIEAATGIPVDQQLAVALTIAPENFVADNQAAAVVQALVVGAQEQLPLITAEERALLVASATEYVADCVDLANVSTTAVVDENCSTFTYYLVR